MHEGEKILSEKELLLEQKRREVDSFVTIYENKDGTERRVGVDPQLREIIALLLALEMHTDQSCWGHPESQKKNEYVELTPSVRLTGNLPDREYTSAEVAAACAEAREHAAKLKELLNEFYQNRKAADDAKIIVDYFDGMPTFELRSQVKREVLAGCDEINKARCIEAARKEWRAFEDFLKKYYFTHTSQSLKFNATIY